jgi:hypothetical protein
VIWRAPGLAPPITKWLIWTAILLSPLYLGPLRRRLHLPGLPRFRLARKSE